MYYVWVSAVVRETVGDPDTIPVCPDRVKFSPLAKGGEIYALLVNVIPDKLA
jgi:uncharacterized membrane protein